jgi:hypothetical protein
MIALAMGPGQKRTWVGWDRHRHLPLHSVHEKQGLSLPQVFQILIAHPNQIRFDAPDYELRILTDS